MSWSARDLVSVARRVAVPLLATSVGVLGLPGPGAAQTSAGDREKVEVLGWVVDARNREPIPATFVHLEGHEIGSLTEEEGRFRLELTEEEASGRVTLVAEALGYEAFEWSGRLPDGYLVLDLEPRPEVLEGLEVVVDRFERRRRAVPTSFRVFDQFDLARSTQPSILDHVRAHTGVQIVTCPRRAREQWCVWRRGGRRGVQVYIDEFATIGGMGWLETLSPADVYMVEVYDRGTHIRVYTRQFMENAAKMRLLPVNIFD